MRHSSALIAAAALLFPACRDEVESAPPRATPPPSKPAQPPPPVGIDPKPSAPAPLPKPPAPPPAPSSAESDVRIAQEIRSAILDKSTLSTNAHGVQVTCVDGVVTLRGPVDSDVERDTVETLAKSVAGVARVDNQLEVKP